MCPVLPRKPRGEHSGLPVIFALVVPRPAWTLRIAPRLVRLEFPDHRIGPGPVESRRYLVNPFLSLAIRSPEPYAHPLQTSPFSSYLIRASSSFALDFHKVSDMPDRVSPEGA